MLHIGVQVAQALQHAHRQGILHGDVKPSNVLLTDGGRAVLLDFNLAIFEDESTPFIAGTLPYMAPEQLRPLAVPGTPLDKSLDERSDVFSLGVTLFELLYGRSPFGAMPAESSRDLIAGRLLDRQQQGPVFPSDTAAGDDQGIREILARCLACDPALRPQSMGELLEMLQAQLKPTRRAWRWLGRHRRLTMTAAVLFFAGVLAVSGWQMSREPYPIRAWRAGVAAYERADYAEAVYEFTEALRYDPGLVDAQLRRGIAYSKLKQARLAHDDLDPLSRSEESDLSGFVMVALAHLLTELDRNFPQAGASYEAATKRGYSSAIVYNNLGFCWTEETRLVDAAKALEEACRLDPQLRAAWQNRAFVEFVMAFRQRRPPDTAFIERALVLGPRTAQLDLDAARTYALCAEFASNQDERRRLTKLVCDFASAGLGRGFCQRELDVIVEVHNGLQNDPAWKNLDAPAGKSGLRAERLMLDPIPELLRLLPAAPWRSSKPD